MTQGNIISLVNNLNFLQSLSESTWTINSMKTIQYFQGYQSNTYLVDSRNLQNLDLLNQISKSDIFGCFFDIAIDGKCKINQLAVACSQGVVIFNSFEKKSNDVMKNFFSTISSKKCYVRGVTSYYKLLSLYNINLTKYINVDTDENYSGFLEFRKQSPFLGFSDNYRAKLKSQSSGSNDLVLECLVNAFEAACIDYYFKNLNKKGSSVPDIRTQLSFPPGMNFNPESRNQLSFPPGMNINPDQKSQPSFPPGMNIQPNFDFPPGMNPHPRQLNPKIISQQRYSLEPQNTYQNNIYSNKQEPPPNNNQKEKETTFSISVDMLKSSNKKASEIDKRFWKDLDTLVAILASTKKIEVEDGKYYCKQCNENFVSYEFLLEHCWNEHKSALE